MVASKGMKGSEMLAIINGRVIDPKSKFDGMKNLFIRDGLIVEISEQSPNSDCDIFDADGLCVLPGFIDIHTHLREPGFEYKEDIESGSRAAIAGGFTTILSMPNTKPVCDNVSVIGHIIERAKSIDLTNIYPIAAISIGLEGKELADIAGMVAEGAVAISDDGACVQNDDLMREAMLVAKKLGIVTISHPENSELSLGGVINDGRIAKKLGLKGIPRIAENSMIGRDILLCRETNAPLHIAHVSTVEGIDMLRAAKSDGLPITCEVTPHHLLLTEDSVEELGANAKMNPPLRTKRDCDALIEALSDGTVDAIATDHAPHAPEEKIDINSAPFGIIGMESAFSACMQLVEGGRLSFKRLIWLLTAGPAQAMGLSAGTLEVGVAADITIVDPKKSSSFNESNFHSKSQNSPFIGQDLVGSVLKCYRSGTALPLK